MMPLIGRFDLVIGFRALGVDIAQQFSTRRSSVVSRSARPRARSLPDRVSQMSSLVGPEGHAAMHYIRRTSEIEFFSFLSLARSDD